MEEEIWKPVYRYHGILEASNLGRIKLLSGLYCHSDRILRGRISSSGYYRIGFNVNNKQYNEYSHILVAEAFYLPEEYNLIVTHLDGNKLNNTPTNLKWISRINHSLDNYNLRKIVFQYDLSGNLIKEWVGIGNVSRSLGINISYLSKHLKGQYKQCKGYIFKTIRDAR